MQAYDPLDYENLARSVVQALLGGPDEPLPPRESFEGSGVYALYYHGDFRGYSRLVKAREAPPIYVGKAVPAGARKGGRRLSAGRELCQRLSQHAESIKQAQNLALNDFTCRYLVVVPVWITLAERFLVEHYQPVWNVPIDGSGNGNEYLHSPDPETAVKEPLDQLARTRNRVSVMGPDLANLDATINLTPLWVIVRGIAPPIAEPDAIWAPDLGLSLHVLEVVMGVQTGDGFAAFSLPVFESRDVLRFDLGPGEKLHQFVRRDVLEPAIPLPDHGRPEGL
jgi:hypothetical protein